MAENQPGYKFGKGGAAIPDFGIEKAVKGVTDAVKSKRKQELNATVDAHMLTLNHRLDLEHKVLDRTHAADTFLRVDKTLGERNPEGVIHNYTQNDFGNVTRHKMSSPEEEGAGEGHDGGEAPENSPVENNLNKYQFPQGSTQIEFKEPDTPNKPNLNPIFQEPNQNNQPPAPLLNTQMVNEAVSSMIKGVQSRHVNAYKKAHQEFYGAGFTPENNPTGHARLQVLHAKAKSAFPDKDEFEKRVASYPL